MSCYLIAALSKALCLFAFVAIAAFHTSGSAKADAWMTDNKMSRIVVHAYCGNPLKENGDINEMIVDENRCFCGNRFAADPSESAAKKACGGANVPNYTSDQISRADVLEALLLLLYGDDHNGELWCTEFEGSDCKKDHEKNFSGLIGIHNEVLVSGHLVSALVGEKDCLTASQAGEGWHKGTALKDMDLSVLQQAGLQAEFERGCGIDYNKVWAWKKGN